jgi:glyoxylase-like metal-dependent hydrolase (beta-lactamase superfamily II)
MSPLTPDRSTSPHVVLAADQPSPHTIFAFAPNRDTLGGTAYLIVEKPLANWGNLENQDNRENQGNILIDCPIWNDANQEFLQQQGVRWLFLTHRGAIGQVRAIQAALDCDIVIQAQEAYLLPGLKVTSFAQEFIFTPNSHAFWTAGHSPGSACLYHRPSGILFSGRHLLPDRHGRPVPLRTAKTFHWPRQQRNVQRLLDQFTPETLKFICPGASIGMLRGEFAIAQAYEQLQQGVEGGQGAG